jgi:hypothetical protein
MEQQDRAPTGRSLSLRNYGRADLETVNSQLPDDSMNLHTTPTAQSAESRVHPSQSHQPRAPFSHPPLVFRQSTTSRFPNQRLQEVISSRDSSRVQSEHRTTQLDFPRGRPVSSRSRSRSPTAITRPLLYRDRSLDITTSRHESSSALSQAARSGAVCDSAELERRAGLDKLRKEKNDYAVCVTCWLKDLPCDHQWRCNECKVSGSSCEYIVCPMENCALDLKCPCYHKNKTFPQDSPPRSIGSSMHLIALLSLHGSLIDSYEMSNIQVRLQSPSSAQKIYLQLQQKIEDMAQQGQGFRHHEAVKLLRGWDKMPKVGRRAQTTIARLIVELVKEKK